MSIVPVYIPSPYNVFIYVLEGQGQKHLCQLVLIYVTILNQLFWKLTKERFTLREVNFVGAAKMSSILSITLLITPWTLMLMLHIRQSVYLVLSCFICFISDCPHYIQWNFITILKYEHIIAPHVSSTSIFTRIVQTVLCWFRYIWSNDMFVLWNHISSTF